MKRIVFFDTTWNQILRVGNLVSKYMKEGSNIITFGLVFETSGKKICSINSQTYFNDYLVTTNIYEVEAYLNNIKPDVVVFAQNTIPDLAAILFSQRIGAKIVMLQHGLLYDGASLNNVRIGEIFLALLKIKKTLSYFSIMHLMCKHERKSFFRLVNKIISKKNNVTTTVQNYFNPPLRGETAFVIGKHWIDYYHNNYGYNKKDIFVMGNHDVDDLKDNIVLEDAICYIPSVHVEDGHVTINVFNDFLENLAAAIPSNKKFYIKLHPRSNINIYKKVFNGKNVEFINGSNLPYVNIYIGHNSSLLSKALQISGILILWKFKEEKELFYKDFAYAVCNDGTTIKNAIKRAISNPNDNKKADIERFSYKNPIGAYNFCAKKIIDIYLYEN